MSLSGEARSMIYVLLGEDTINQMTRHLALESHSLIMEEHLQEAKPEVSDCLAKANGSKLPGRSSRGRNQLLVGKNTQKLYCLVLPFFHFVNVYGWENHILSQTMEGNIRKWTPSWQEANICFSNDAEKRYPENEKHLSSKPWEGFTKVSNPKLLS